MKKIINAIIAAMLSASAVASGSTGVPVPVLVKSWDKALNMTVVWEAGTQYDGRIVALEKEGTVSSLKTFQSALTALNKLLSRADEVPLVACVWPDRIVVRRANQPDCGLPI